ncbi:uncharacterized protein LOC129587224 isoform X2 [Paramacrobiotus metropolitanus]|uniref:uncharacterized protein LOC129587224 isoform X2 n=1 Tax=Paramacrobiotus metropolitanus TaxID=2943436 RepID=UPI002446169D|nr:uncharacterized protein LOC129587224 isoform X2 [Paramacrobiotus metropolitanus]
MSSAFLMAACGIVSAMLHCIVVASKGFPMERENTEGGGYRLVEGDIIVDSVPEKDFQKVSMLENARSADDSRWENGIVVFTLGRHLSEDLVTRVHDAMANITLETNNCIRFRNRSNENVFVVIDSDGSLGCRSNVGRQRKQPQTVFLHTDCTLGNIIHELLHTLGFFHEHTRPDRDNYIRIRSANIKPTHVHNYDKPPEKDTTQLGHPYDFSSIMHYPAFDYGAAINTGLPVMESVDPHISLTTNTRLSPLDVKKILRHYQCEDRDTDICTLVVGSCSVYHSTLNTSNMVSPQYRKWLDRYSGLRDCTRQTPKNAVSVYCQPGAKPDDARTIAGILRNRLEVSNYTLFVVDTVLRQSGRFALIKDKIVSLWISTCTTDSVTSRLKRNNFTNLIEFGVHNCSRQRVLRNDFAGNRLLRRIVFHATSIAFLERDTFAELNNLQVLQLEEWWLPRIHGKPRKEEVIHQAILVHCSCEYQWLRDWLTRKPELTGAKNANAVYPGSRELKVGEIYLSVDCTNPRLTVRNWANGHVTSASYNLDRNPFALNAARCTNVTGVYLR